MRNYIETNICHVEKFDILKENKFRSVYLVNNKLVVVFSSKAKNIFNWYMSNQEFAPNSLFATDKCICYDFLVPNSEHLTKDKVINLFKNYLPECLGSADASYYVNLDVIYRDNCNYLDIVPKNLEYPRNELLYNIHGNMDFNHTIYYDGQPIMLDPRPKNGTLSYDIINYYYSCEEISKMFSESEIIELLAIDEKCFNFYKEIIVIKKIRRLDPNDLQMFNFYKSILN